ncbi:RNA polymerase sigma factor [Patescibacteria group bacterium]
MANLKKEFVKIYDKYIDKIYRFIYFKVNTEEIAQDLCSETFVRCWDSYKQNKIDNPQAFLYTIARNLVTDHYRDKAKMQFVSIENTVLTDPRPGFEEKIALDSEMEQVKAGLANLKEDYQNAIILYYLDDLPIKEVAHLLDRSEEATRVLVHRALTSLRQNLGPKLGTKLA